MPYVPEPVLCWTEASTARTSAVSIVVTGSADTGGASSKVDGDLVSARGLERHAELERPARRARGAEPVVEQLHVDDPAHARLGGQQVHDADAHALAHHQR